MFSFWQDLAGRMERLEHAQTSATTRQLPTVPSANEVRVLQYSCRRGKARRLTHTCEQDGFLKKHGLVIAAADGMLQLILIIVLLIMVAAA